MRKSCINDVYNKKRAEPVFYFLIEMRSIMGVNQFKDHSAGLIDPGICFVSARYTCEDESLA